MTTNPLAQRKTLAAAYCWKEEKLSELQAHIEIQWALLASLLDEQRELQAKQGQELAARFFAESSEELALTKQAQTDFLEEIQAGLLWQPYVQKKAKAA